MKKFFVILSFSILAFAIFYCVKLNSCAYTYVSDKAQHYCWETTLLNDRVDSWKEIKNPTEIQVEFCKLADEVLEYREICQNYDNSWLTPVFSVRNFEKATEKFVNEYIKLMDMKSQLKDSL